MKIEDNWMHNVPIVAIGMVVVALFAAGAGFFFGRPCSAFVAYAAFVMAFAFAAKIGWRTAFAFVLVVCVCLCATCFSWSYTGEDTFNYHAPMQLLLRDGWNPVFDSSVEKFESIACGLGLKTYHTLFLPKTQAIAGALVSLATGLWLGDSFLGYILMVCLFLTAFGFAEQTWRTSPRMSALFAFTIVASPKLSCLFSGFVDFTVYASLMIAAFSLFRYQCGRRLSDLALFAMSGVICSTTKSTGLVALGLLAIGMAWPLRREVPFWRTILVMAFLTTIIGASPLITAWIQYGSPFYPSMTFNPKVALVDITNDFTGNDDAMSMGYFSRMSYAWISSALTVKVLALLHSNQSFCPEFTVPGGVAGFGLWFNALLWTGIAMLFLARRGAVQWLCALLLVSANFAPLKYIGYARYFPQIWALPAIAAFNFLYAPGERVKGCRRIHKMIGFGFIWIIAAVSLLILMRTAAYQGRMLAVERNAQRVAGEMLKTSSVWYADEKNFKYTYVHRLALEGIELRKSVSGADGPRVRFECCNPITEYDKSPLTWRRLNATFPICQSPIDLIRFNWADAYGDLPRILWR